MYSAIIFLESERSRFRRFESGETLAMIFIFLKIGRKRRE